MDITFNAGGAGSFSFDDSSSPALPQSGRGRVRSNDFGLPERSGLMDLARTYLETQARLWPDLAGTPAVPAADAATIATMADDFEQRFRQQHAEAFRQGDTPIAWIALAVAYLRSTPIRPLPTDQSMFAAPAACSVSALKKPRCFLLVADSRLAATIADRSLNFSIPLLRPRLHVELRVPDHHSGTLTDSRVPMGCKTERNPRRGKRIGFRRNGKAHQRRTRA